MLQLIGTEIVGLGLPQEFDVEHRPSILCLPRYCQLLAAKIARRRAILRPLETLALGHDSVDALCTSHINNLRD